MKNGRATVCIGGDKDWHGFSRSSPVCNRNMAVLLWLGVVEPRSVPV